MIRYVTLKILSVQSFYLFKGRGPLFLVSVFFNENSGPDPEKLVFLAVYTNFLGADANFCGMIQIWRYYFFSVTDINFLDNKY